MNSFWLHLVLLRIKNNCMVLCSLVFERICKIVGDIIIWEVHSIGKVDFMDISDHLFEGPKNWCLQLLNCSTGYHFALVNLCSCTLVSICVLNCCGHWLRETTFNNKQNGNKHRPFDVHQLQGDVDRTDVRLGLCTVRVGVLNGWESIGINTTSSIVRYKIQYFIDWVNLL